MSGHVLKDGTFVSQRCGSTLAQTRWLETTGLSFSPRSGVQKSEMKVLAGLGSPRVSRRESFLPLAAPGGYWCPCLVPASPPSLCLPVAFFLGPPGSVSVFYTDTLVEVRARPNQYDLMLSLILRFHDMNFWVTLFSLLQMGRTPVMKKKETTTSKGIYLSGSPDTNAQPKTQSFPQPN